MQLLWSCWRRLSPRSEARQAATDVTQWRGANRDGVVTGFTAPAAWPENLTQRWKIDIGLGYATPLVVGNRVYVFSRQGEDEVMSAVDAASGKVLWRTAYPAPFEMSSAAKAHGPGPKSTPVFVNGRLYAIGMTGAVTAYDAATGKQVWQKPGSMPLPMYTSHSFSPIVDGGLVIFHVGGHDKGALTAFDLNTGAEKWSWNGDGPGYGSPIVADFGGVRQLVTITQAKLVGVDVATGALLWERPFASSNFTNSITPLRFGQSVVVWNNNGPMRAVTIARRDNKWVAEEAWTSDDPPNRLSNTVLDGDVMFGMTQRNMGQVLRGGHEDREDAVGVGGAAGGKRRAGARRRHHFQYGERRRAGYLPREPDRIRADQALPGSPRGDVPTWAQPAISGNRIFVKDASTLSLWTIN